MKWRCRPTDAFRVEEKKEKQHKIFRQTKFYVKDYGPQVVGHKVFALNTQSGFIRWMRENALRGIGLENLLQA